MNEPIAFANVVLKGSRDGVITDDNGNFYFESAGNYDILIVSFVGYDKVELKLVPGLNKDLKIVLKSGISLNEVTVYTGKTSKKNNPALDILRKIWERRRKNGLKMFKHYQYDKYEKVEFDLNTIDLIKSNSLLNLLCIFDFVYVFANNSNCSTKFGKLKFMFFSFIKLKKYLYVSTFPADRHFFFFKSYEYTLLFINCSIFPIDDFEFILNVFNINILY